MGYRQRGPREVQGEDRGVTDSSAQAVGLTGSVVFLEDVFHQQMGLKPRGEV